MLKNLLVLLVLGQIQSGLTPSTAGAGITNPYKGTFIADAGESATLFSRTTTVVTNAYISGVLAPNGTNWAVDAGAELYAAVFCAYYGGCTNTLSDLYMDYYEIDGGTAGGAAASCSATRKAHIEMGTYSLASGAGVNISFKTLYASPPVCTCSIPVNTGTCDISATASVVTILNASGAVAMSWICVGCI